jgi:drug/metabolite transporter (DMT)-like permease
MNATQWLLLVVLSVLWGATFLFVGIAVKELPALTIVLARVGLAAVILLPVVLLSGHSLPGALRGWGVFAVMAVLNNLVPFTLIATGQKEIASGLASVLNGATPLFTVLIAWALAGERPAMHAIAGIVVGITGIAVLVGPDAVVGNTASVLGMLCVLGAALSYGFSGFWGRRLRAVPPLVSACAQLLCSSVMLAPVALLVDSPWRLAMPSPATLASILAMAVFSTALAYILFFRIMAVSGPANAMLVTLLIPVSGIWLGAAVLGEPVLARHLAGAGVIALALLLIDGRILRRLRYGVGR